VNKMSIFNIFKRKEKLNEYEVYIRYFGCPEDTRIHVSIRLNDSFVLKRKYYSSKASARRGAYRTIEKHSNGKFIFNGFVET